MIILVLVKDILRFVYFFGMFMILEVWCMNFLVNLNMLIRCGNKFNEYLMNFVVLVIMVVEMLLK